MQDSESLKRKEYTQKTTPFLFGVRVVITAVFLLPIFWMISASLHPRATPLPTYLNLLPQGLTLENFVRASELIPVGRFTLNSLQVVLVAVPLTLLTSSWAGFAMAQLPRRSQQRWVLISLIVLMVPGIALWSTRFLVYEQLGWFNSVWALAAPAWMGTSPFYVLMFYRAFRRIPTAVYDAARMDGAGVLDSWWHIAFPIARPTAVGVGLLSFVVYWGDFISPLLYLRSQNHFTLPVGLQLLQQMGKSDWPLLMAAAVFTTAIPVGLFLLLQPYFARHDH